MWSTGHTLFWEIFGSRSRSGARKGPKSCSFLTAAIALFSTTCRICQGYSCTVIRVSNCMVILGNDASFG